MSKPQGGPARVRRSVHRYGDPYLPDFNPGETAICTGCHAIFRRRHWLLDEAEYGQLSRRRDTRRILCPACRKIRDRYYEGEVTLAAGAFLEAHEGEILNLIRNEEERARGVNPLERIVAVRKENGRVVVTTTNEKLAQRIGRELRKAFRGRTEYLWSEDNRSLRVRWRRD
jgi:NMD protein affecting ribosome stability and mRNA decay